MPQPLLIPITERKTIHLLQVIWLLSVAAGIYFGIEVAPPDLGWKITGGIIGFVAGVVIGFALVFLGGKIANRLRPKKI